MSKEIENKENKKLFYDGIKNKIIRHWYYNQRGLNVFNEFKYLFMFIFGIYYTLKMDNPFWLVLMFVLILPILSIAGYIHVHHISKVIDFLNVQFATHWSRYQFKLYEDMLTELRKLNDKTRS